MVTTSVRNEHKVNDGRRLGRAKPDRSKPRLALRDFLTGVVPPVPPVADHFNKVPQWGLYKNNVWGICGPTMAANSRRLITQYLTGKMVSPSQEDVNDLYRRSTSPSFDPATGANDNGVVLQTMLAEVVKNGLGGVKALGFAEVNHTNIEEMMAAIAIFGFICVGVNLQTAQQAQTDKALWDYSRSGEWGGHAVLGGRYKDDTADANDRTAVITWAEPVDMTDAFIENQLDEAWVLIWPEHLSDQTFMQGVDVHAFASAYESITGRPFPAPLPASPAPNEGPVPGSLTVDSQVMDRITHAARRADEDPNVWANTHFRHYFKIKG